MWSAAFSPDGQRVVTASADKTARIWDAATHQQIAVLRHDGFVLSAAFSPDGRRVVTALNDATARVWDAETYAQIAVLKEGSVWPIQSAAFSPDGKRIVTASWHGTAQIWDAETYTQIAVLKGGSGLPFHSAEFSPDGRRVVTASQDRTASIWDAETHVQTVLLTGHGDAVKNAKFSPNGRQVVTASRDKTVRIWDADTGIQIALIRANGSSSSAGFSPDGRRVIAAVDKTARLWHVFPTTQEIVDYAKTAVPRCLTVPQRKKFSLDAQAPDWCYELGKWPYSRPRFGISVQNLNDEIIKRLNLKQSEGVLVIHVIKGLPAAAAGFMLDDVVVAVDGKSMPQTKIFLETINAAAPEQQLAVTIIRGNKIKELTMTPQF